MLIPLRARLLSVPEAGSPGDDGTTSAIDRE